MESKWRLNVWEQGLSDSPIRLMARYNDPFGSDEYFVTQGSPAGPCLVFSRPDMAVWVVAATIAPPPSHPNFPWGWDVEPDE